MEYEALKRCHECGRLYDGMECPECGYFAQDYDDPEAYDEDNIQTFCDTDDDIFDSYYADDYATDE